MPIADICIIGSGPGGSVMAKTLCEAGYKVVLFERGPRYRKENFIHSHRRGWEITETAMQQNDQLVGYNEFSYPKADPLDPAYEHLRSKAQEIKTNRNNIAGGISIARVLGLGGSTIHFQGMAERFDPTAFKIKSTDDVGVDWPINYKDIAPYYSQIEKMVGVSGPAHDAPLPAHPLSYATQHVKQATDKLGFNMEACNIAILSQPYKGRKNCSYINGCVRGCPTGAKSSADIAFISAAESTGNLKINLLSQVYKITSKKSGRVKSVLYHDQDGKSHEQKARIIILSTGAIETPRILLNSSNEYQQQGLANSSGLVGRGIMQTLMVAQTIVFDKKLGSYKGLPADNIIRDFKTTQPNTNYRRGFHMEVSQNGVDLLGPNSYAGRLAPRWGKKHKDWMRKHFGAAVNISAMGEQLPDDNNRITLSSFPDRFGQPVSEIRLRFGQNDLNMMTAMKAKVEQIRSATSPHSLIEEFYAYDLAYGGAELRGGCRMGKTKTDSVVNSYGQAHDHKNLFIMDASVFPSGGTGAPSLTIEAVSLRGAEYLIEEIKSGRIFQ